MRLFKIFVFAVMAMVPMLSAAYTVGGTVVDANNEPEAFATVRIYSQSDTLKPVTMGVTDEQGAFVQQISKPGNYKLQISSVGKQTLSLPFALTVNDKNMNVGTLRMLDNSEMLGEVEVVATKPLVKKEIDRIGYDVQADEDSKTSNVQDILRKVPMVTVDADGSIKVKGGSNFKIYKDGRPSNSFTSNAKDIFAAIPASMIEKIEVITDPGAKEDAEGVGAILNIVTVKNSSMNGVMGNVRAGMMTNNPVPAGGIWLTGNVGKLVMSVNGGYFHQSEKMSESLTEAEYKYADTGNMLSSLTESKGKGDFVFYGIDGSYELDSLNLFTLEFGGHWYDFKNTSKGTDSMFDPMGNSIYGFNSFAHTPKNRSLEFNGNFNYQHSTRRKGETLTFSYQISNSNTDNVSNLEYLDITGAYSPNYKASNNVSDLHFIENTFQLDWTRPINPFNTFAVGGKFISRSNGAVTDIDYTPRFDSDAARNDATNFSHVTNIGAAYADYRFTKKRFSARAGLRYEYSYLSAKDRNDRNDRNDQTTNYHSSLSDWVPNASVMYTLTQSSSLKLAYSSRINRPGINFLNPTKTDTPTSESVGNPRLASVHYNEFTLNYSLFTSKFNFDVSASYDFTNGAISQVASITDPNRPDFISYTYDNIGRTRNFYFSVFAQWSVTPTTNLMTNASVQYAHIEYPGLQRVSNQRWGGSIFFRASQMLPWKLRLEGMCFFQPGNLDDVYSYTKNNAHGLFHGFSLQRSFLKNDALTVKLATRNPFNSKFEYRNFTNRGPYNGHSFTTMPNMRIFGVELSYRFGSVKASVKKTASTISNDDLQGGTSAPSQSQGGMSM